MDENIDPHVFYFSMTTVC